MDQREKRQLPDVPQMASHLRFNDHYRSLKNGGEELWWGDLDDEPGGDGTALIMKEGVSIRRHKLTQKEYYKRENKIWDVKEDRRLERQIWDDVTSCMEVLHSRTLVHRDIREPNILFFGDQAQLIDYAYSTKPGYTEEYLGTTPLELLGTPQAVRRWTFRTDYTLFKIVLQRLQEGEDASIVKP